MKTNEVSICKDCQLNKFPSNVLNKSINRFANYTIFECEEFFNLYFCWS